MVSCRLDQQRALRILGAFVLTCLLVIWLNPNWTDRSIHRVLDFDPDVDLSDSVLHGEICSSHGWKPYKDAVNRKVYDLIMINTELDWLEIRLNSTYDHVDYFVIVESNKTFTNLDKPLIVKDNKERFAPYWDKVLYHQLEIPAGFHSDRPNPAWDWEDLQRNAMYLQVFPALKGTPAAPQYGDVMVVADVDEILRPQTLVVLRACRFPRRLTLRSDFFYYSFQWKHVGPEWAHPEATYYQGWRTIKPENLRNRDGAPQPQVKLESAELWNAGWHCSSAFATIAEVQNKLRSFSHREYNQPKYTNPDAIANRVRNGLDLFDRETEKFERVEDNQDLPPFLLANEDRFKYLLDRDGPSAGFSDYP